MTAHEVRVYWRTKSVFNRARIYARVFQKLTWKLLVFGCYLGQKTGAVVG